MGNNNESCCMQEVPPKISVGMRTYVGCKILRAIQMTDVEFERERSIFIESKENVDRYINGFSIGIPVGHIKGILQDKENSPCPKEGYKVIYPDGYVSWSPKHVFEQCYRLVSVDEKNLI